MWLFGKGAEQRPSKASQAEQQDRVASSMAALAEGNVPGYVEKRIDVQRQGAIPWTSDLSVSEWLLLKQFGLRPLGMVMGSSVYHIGRTASNYSGTWTSRSIPEIENALLEVRQRALWRMQEEARLLGAHAVVGVRLDSHLPGFEDHQTEFTAFGTAVALDGERVPDEPLMCTVSALDFVRLLKAGSIPVSVGLGIAAYYQYTTRRDSWRTNSWFNQEVVSFTDSVYEVRHLAMRNLKQQIQNHDGHGVLASDMHLKVHKVEVERGEDDEREDHILEFVASGTIVSSSSTRLSPAINLSVSLNEQVPHRQG